jgi:erythromycin esterase-like protein
MSLLGCISKNAYSCRGSPEDYNHLMNAIGDAKVVMIGEASHGTTEFYRERAEITKRLIMKKDFLL